MPAKCSACIGCHATELQGPIHSPHRCCHGLTHALNAAAKFQTSPAGVMRWQACCQKQQLGMHGAPIACARQLHMHAHSEPAQLTSCLRMLLRAVVCRWQQQCMQQLRRPCQDRRSRTSYARRSTTVSTRCACTHCSAQCHCKPW